MPRAWLKPYNNIKQQFLIFDNFSRNIFAAPGSKYEASVNAQINIFSLPTIINWPAFIKEK